VVCGCRWGVEGRRLRMASVDRTMVSRYGIITSTHPHQRRISTSTRMRRVGYKRQSDSDAAVRCGTHNERMRRTGQNGRKTEMARAHSSDHSLASPFETRSIAGQPRETYLHRTSKSSASRGATHHGFPGESWPPSNEKVCGADAQLPHHQHQRI